MTKVYSTKRSLITSVIALMLCFSMLLGTTFAWFTDSVTSANNIIKSGNLDIGLAYKTTGMTDYATVDSTTNIFKDDTLWEPGHVEVVNLKISNLGSLALKYQLGVNVVNEVTSINVNDGTLKLSEHIKYGFVDGEFTADREAAIAAVEAKNPTALNIPYSSDVANLYPENATGASEAIVTLIVYMPETVGNETNYKLGEVVPTINLGINLFATQLESEFDSFDNQYDSEAVYYDTLVTTADELYDAVANAGETTVIAIDGNIKLTKQLSKSGLKSIKFVAFSKNAVIDQATYNMSFPNANVTFDGLTLTHGEKTYGDGGQTSTAFAVWHASEVNYIDCTFNRSVGTIHAKLHNFIGCTFNGVENPGNTKSEYPLYICDGQDYNVVDCVFNCTNRGAILFFNDGGTGVDTLNISNTKFLGDIIDDKTAVEIHNNAGTQVYNVNIKDVVVGSGIINGLYRIKPANVGVVNVNVDDASVTTGAEIVSDKADLIAFSAKALTGNNGKAEVATIILDSDIDMGGADFSAIVAQRGDTLNIIGNGHTISNAKVVSGANDNTTGQAGMFYAYPNSTLAISDLKLKNITVTADQNGTGYAAVIAGYCEGKLILDNVDIEGATVTGVKSSGLMVGHLSGSLEAKDCELSGTVTLADFAEELNGHYAGKYIGTLAGSATLTNCTVNATVSGNLNAANIGDIFGRKTAAGSLN